MNKGLSAALVLLLATLVSGCSTTVVSSGPVYSYTDQYTCSPNNYNCKSYKSHANTTGYWGTSPVRQPVVNTCQCNGSNYSTSGCGCGPCGRGCEMNWNTYDVDCGSRCYADEWQGNSCGCN